jgi:DNA-directed RNA polymerase subunit M/transcription elongation factor TFIIS
MDPLVTIATFSHSEEAHLNRAKLESEGIDAFVADEYMVNANWLYSIAIGGVKLKVKESDAEAALSILKGISEPIPEEVSASTKSIGEHCPKCNSTYVQYKMFSLRPVFILWLLSNLVFGNYGGFTLPFLKRKWKCHSCGYEWKAEKRKSSKEA